jgi:nitrogen fixation NifU-like protein
MELKSLYREILNEHNINPAHKAEMAGATHTLQGINPSCGDNITLFLKSENGKIADGSFTGSGCAVSQASVDMMLDLVIGKEENEALRLCELFMKMIRGEASEAEIEELDEAGALQDVSHMPSRVKCALLGWRTMKEMIGTGASTGSGAAPHCDTQ